VFSIKVLAVAAAVSAGVVFTMPAPSQAVPQAAPVKIDATNNGNLAQVKYRRHHRYYARHYHRHYYGPYYGVGIRIWPPLCIGFC